MEMSEAAPVVVLTGPAAAGKNTVAREIAKRVPVLAAINADDVRQMLVKPHVAPWGGEEGRRQHELGVKNACGIARSFAEAGFPTLVLDVVTDQLVALYRELLDDLAPRVVLLLPQWSVATSRLRQRAPSITLQEARLVYQWQKELTDVDERIDNSARSAGEVAEMLLPLLSPPYNSRLHPSADSLRSPRGG